MPVTLTVPVPSNKHTQVIPEDRDRTSDDREL